MRFRKWLPILLMIWPYVLWLFRGPENEIAAVVIGSLYLILTVVLYIVNIIHACTCRGERAVYELALFDMLMKLVHIPFYLCVFLIGVVFFFASVVPALLFITPMVIFYLFMIDVFLMLTSSMYGINALIRAQKNGMITTRFMVIHGIFHCFFVTDVISSVIVFVKMRRNVLLTCSAALER